MFSEHLRFLIAESEPPQTREQRRESVGKSSGETYEALVRSIAPRASFTRIKPVDRAEELPFGSNLSQFDAVFLTGSPLHLYEMTPACGRVVDFMHAVFKSGTPSFGSCAGLQIATVTCGGTVRSMGERREAGFARRIFPTEAGRGHPLLAGRPLAFDAPAIHTDEVARLPADALLLASNATTQVQAAEIRSDEAVFWGVQYHPEIDLFEVAGALRRQADDLVEHDLASGTDKVDEQARLIEALHETPERLDLAWRLGQDEQVTKPQFRSTEITNFIRHLALPARAKRGRNERIRSAA